MAYATKDYCSVMNDLAAYERQEALNEIHVEQVQEKFDELFDGDYSPYLLENVVECLANLDHDNVTELQTALNKQDTSLIGTLILNLSHTYWTKSAEEQAKKFVKEEDERARYEDERALCDDY
jgi:hypothetical protein